MALNSTDVWANGIAPAVTPDVKVAAGAECGDADPDVLFNHTLRLYGLAIIELQDTYGSLAYINAQDAALQALIAASSVDIATNTAGLVAAVNDIATNAADIAALQAVAIPTATEVVPGLIEIAGNVEAADLTNNVRAMTPARYKSAGDAHGALRRLYEVSDLTQWKTLVGGTSGSTVQYNAADIQDCKGVYGIEFTDGATTYTVHFEVFWSDPAGSENDQYIDTKILPLQDLRIDCVANTGTTLVDFTILDASGAAKGSVNIQDLRRLRMDSVLP